MCSELQLPAPWTWPCASSSSVASRTSSISTSNVKSITQIELLKVSKKELQKMISESNLFIQGLIRTLSNRVTSYISIVRKHNIKTN